MEQQELQKDTLYLEGSDFFSTSFIESNEIKSFVFERYEKGILYWMKKADVGLLKSKRTIKEKYAKELSVLPDEILGVYEEKFRKKQIVFLYSDQLIVNGSEPVDMDEISIQDDSIFYQGEGADIHLSETAIQFIRDLKRLETYEWEGNYQHPIANLAYESRNRYMKLLLSICVCDQGISIDQIMFLAELAQQFGMNASRLLDFIRKIRRISQRQIAGYIHQEAVGLSDVERKALYVDAAYLIQKGQYNEIQKIMFVATISKIISCPIVEMKKIIYYMEETI